MKASLTLRSFRHQSRGSDFIPGKRLAFARGTSSITSSVLSEVVWSVYLLLAVMRIWRRRKVTHGESLQTGCTFLRAVYIRWQRLFSYVYHARIHRFCQDDGSCGL